VSDGGGGGVGAERFCALVRYQGSFTTLAGQSPASTNTLIDDGIDGSFEGGYLLVFNADELASPAFKTQGHIGTFTGTSAQPITLYDWRPFYFTKVGFDNLQWWGWIYHGGNNGAWVNAIGGINQGNITD
jgi:hypothetical protein